MNYVYLFAAAFFLNIPFGFFRKPFMNKTENKALRFAIMMFMIHIPIPIVYYMRTSFGIDRNWPILIVSILFCILGQVFGGRILPKLLAKPQKSKQQI